MQLSKFTVSFFGHCKKHDNCVRVFVTIAKVKERGIDRQTDRETETETDSI